MIRSSFYRAVAAMGMLSIALASCSGGSGSSTPATPALQNPSFDAGLIPSQLLIKNWGESALKSAQYIGPVSNAMISVNVLVHQQNAAALVQYARDVNDPSSGNFRKWLTPAQLGQQFGASQADYQAAASYFAQQGLSIGAWPQRMMLAVSGGQAAMERAFNTKFGLYQLRGQTFVAPVTMPHFSKVLPIDAVGKMVAYTPMHSYLINAPRAGAGVNIGYSPQQVRAAFDYNGAYGLHYDGTGVTVAIIATGPIDVGGTSGDQDLDALASLYNARVAKVTQVPVTASGVTAGLNKTFPSPSPGASPPAFPFSNAFAPPPAVTAPCNGALPKCNPEDGEAQLDVQQAATIAPGANVDFYLAYNASDCNIQFPGTCPTSGSNAGTPQIGLTEADPEIQQVIADDKADVISMSYGGGETQTFPNGSSDYTGTYSQLEFAELAAEGIAAFASSGDSGSAECLAGGGAGYLPEVCVSYPSGDPNVTSVGGVTLYVDSLGKLAAPVLAWGISTDFNGNGYGATGASGGGTSTFMPAPSWQAAALGNGLREQPDASLVGDPNTGVTFVENANFGGGIGVVGGTSVAAPQMAATWALVLSACKANQGHGFCPANSGPLSYRLGNASPYLYAIYKGTAYHGTSPSLPYGSVMYDVLYGSNEMASNGGKPSAPVPGAKAMTGYDQVTGLGVPYAGHLIQAITGVPVP